MPLGRVAFFHTHEKTRWEHSGSQSTVDFTDPDNRPQREGTTLRGGQLVISTPYTPPARPKPTNHDQLYSQCIGDQNMPASATSAPTRVATIACRLKPSR